MSYKVSDGFANSSPSASAHWPRAIQVKEHHEVSFGESQSWIGFYPLHDKGVLTRINTYSLFLQLDSQAELNVLEDGFNGLRVDVVKLWSVLSQTLDSSQIYHSFHVKSQINSNEVGRQKLLGNGFPHDFLQFGKLIEGSLGASVLPISQYNVDEVRVHCLRDSWLLELCVKLQHEVHPFGNRISECSLTTWLYIG